MANVSLEKDKDFDDPIRTIGSDSTATFDNSASNPTERASSEALGPGEEEVDDGEDEQDNVDESEDLDPMDREAPVSGADLEDEEDEDDEDDDDDDEEDEDDEGSEEDAEDEVGVPVKGS